MTAVLPAAAAIGREPFSADWADPVSILCRMGIPPPVPAGIGAELLFLPARILRHRLPALEAPVFPVIHLGCFRNMKNLRNLVSPFQEGLYSVLGDSKRCRNPFVCIHLYGK